MSLEKLVAQAARVRLQPEAEGQYLMARPLPSLTVLQRDRSE
jgi:hypothetical protein